MKNERPVPEQNDRAANRASLREVTAVIQLLVLYRCNINRRNKAEHEQVVAVTLFSTMARIGLGALTFSGETRFLNTD